MLLTTSVDTDTRTGVKPDAPPQRFPGVDLVDAAAALFAREVQAERAITVGQRLGSTDADTGAWWQVLGPVRDTTTSALDADTLRLVAEGVDGPGPEPQRSTVVPLAAEREQIEGPRWYVEIGPGLVAVRSSDPARAQRAAERALEDHRAKVALEALAVERGEDLPEAGHREITGWSAKSRSRMVRRLAELDYTPMVCTGRPLGMVTLTYSGDWLTVAPESAACHRHLLKLRKRFERHYGVPMVAVWKREFQRRGAPHYHLLMPIPADRNGETFRDWLSRTWVDVVDHPDEVERARHLVAGTGVDMVEGARMADPKRAGVYFSKHGSFAAKDYQNDPPAEWAGTTAGRFWGYWYLKRAVAGVEVAPDVARTVLRTARRLSDANGGAMVVYRWRKVTTVDRETGELGWRWRKRRTRVPVRRLRGPGGYLVVNNGPATGSQLARWAGMATAPDRSRGPLVRGWLP